MPDVKMTSLAAGYRAVVFGASGGIGQALVDHLAADPNRDIVYAGARKDLIDKEKVLPLRFDLLDEATIEAAAKEIGAKGPVDLVLVATGVLHGDGMTPEKTYKALDADVMAAAFAINSTGPALIAKHFLPLLRRDGKSVFAAMSARVGSIDDNRLGGWHAYRASKAALNMLIRTLAIELTARNAEAVCVALHPGTVDTNLSKPFQTGIASEKMLAPEQSAAAMLRVLDEMTADQTGTLIAWDGKTVPF